MKTYQDFEKACASEREQGNFLLSAVNEHRASDAYRKAKAGMAYYNKHNITMEKYQKFLYTLSGNKIEDVFSSNYKLKTLMFRRLVMQQVQYVLGNGLQMDRKEKLGKDIDFKLQEAAKMALAQGVGYAFWNFDHVEIFSFADDVDVPGFVPLKDEKTSAVKAGIRYWFRNVGNNVVFRATLYEEDGISEWVKEGDEKDVKLMAAKRSYIRTISTDSTGIVDETESNYGVLPIAQLWGNDTHESELVGIREKIDCYDFIESGLANTIDDTSGFYWILRNAGGMDDVDLSQFIQRIKTVKAATVDSEDGSAAEAHTFDVPYESRKAMLEILRHDIYEDFQMLDVSLISGTEKTATEIQAAYQSQDNKCADFEYMLIDFVQQIASIAGIADAEPKFVWNKIINRSEETQMVLSAANYLDDETILRYLPFVSTDDIDNILKKLDTGNMQRMGVNYINRNQNDVIEPENDDDAEE